MSNYLQRLVARHSGSVSPVRPNANRYFSHGAELSATSVRDDLVRDNENLPRFAQSEVAGIVDDQIPILRRASERSSNADAKAQPSGAGERPGTVEALQSSAVNKGRLTAPSLRLDARGYHVHQEGGLGTQHEQGGADPPFARTSPREALAEAHASSSLARGTEEQPATVTQPAYGAGAASRVATAASESEPYSLTTQVRTRHSGAAQDFENARLVAMAPITVGAERKSRETGLPERDTGASSAQIVLPTKTHPNDSGVGSTAAATMTVPFTNSQHSSKVETEPRLGGGKDVTEELSALRHADIGRISVDETRTTPSFRLVDRDMPGSSAPLERHGSFDHRDFSESLSSSDVPAGSPSRPLSGNGSAQSRALSPSVTLKVPVSSEPVDHLSVAAPSKHETKNSVDTLMGSPMLGHQRTVSSDGDVPYERATEPSVVAASLNPPTNTQPIVRDTSIRPNVPPIPTVETVPSVTITIGTVELRTPSTPPTPPPMPRFPVQRAPRLTLDEYLRRRGERS